MEPRHVRRAVSREQHPGRIAPAKQDQGNTKGDKKMDQETTSENRCQKEGCTREQGTHAAMRTSGLCVEHFREQNREDVRRRRIAQLHPGAIIRD